MVGGFRGLSDCIHLSSAVLFQRGCATSSLLRREGEYLKRVIRWVSHELPNYLPNISLQLWSVVANAENSGHSDPNAIQRRPQEDPYLTFDLFTNRCIQPIQLSNRHTHTPSFSCNRSSLLSWLALHPLLPPHIFYCHRATWLSAGSKHKETFMEGTGIQSVYSNSRPSVAPSPAARRERITFRSRCLDTESWSFCAGHKAWFLPALDHWRCADSSPCTFLHASEKRWEWQTS